MPSIDDWAEDMSKPLNRWANVSIAECLQGKPSIIKALRGFEDTPRWTSLRECQSYLLELLKQLGSSAYAGSRVARSLSCICIHMLLGGDASFVVDLLQDLVICLQEAGYLDNVDRESTVNEFKSLVVDLRQHSSDPALINDVFEYLEASQSYQCRVHVKEVIRLLRVIVCPVPDSMSFCCSLWVLCSTVVCASSEMCIERSVDCGVSS